MISVKKIIYKDKSSEDFNNLDLICNLAFDSDDGGTDSWLNREAVASETYRGEFKRVHNYKYTDTLSPQFTFIKKDFSDFTLEGQRTVLAWLTSNNTASYLSVYYGNCNSDSAELAYELLGGFTEIELYKMGNGRVVGIVATFESVAPYAFSPVASKEYTHIGHYTESIHNNLCPFKFEIYCNTDEPSSYIYPKVTILQGSVAIGLENGIVTKNDIDISDGFKDDIISDTIYYEYSNNKFYIKTSKDNKLVSGIGAPNTYPEYDTLKSSIIIKNETIGTKTQIINIPKGEQIIIDGANQIITTLTNENRIYADDFNWQWFPLQEGKNQISIIGHVSSIKFEWREPMKVGEV